MSCPTCDHTMQSVANGVHWCPRCGTLRTSGDTWEAPKLVDRCRAYRAGATLPWKNLWITGGIEESIFLPRDRRND